ncbi:hypothetical protein [Amycolatopsis panacis]|uniref:hypothetical protein n=1 Tax=Amycolatopsis panacis TaxID=2340917 RepID=UPI0011C3799B|nr:hypothetical protein [Amycolatopsis panacis]
MRVSVAAGEVGLWLDCWMIGRCPAPVFGAGDESGTVVRGRALIRVVFGTLSIRIWLDLLG